MVILTNVWFFCFFVFLVFFFSKFSKLKMWQTFPRKNIIKFSLIYSRKTQLSTHTHTHTKSPIFFFVKKTTKFVPKKTTDRLLGTYQM